ncbi:hypothetical protein I5W21_13860 [Stenotrophomonas maltophilia]|uniref:hypothetical protein n=1 Tax=Stenotrophomonas TaxID=40323 RepID=UPI0011B21BF3|nr:hypothetical protein [Stenotrophomonas maltophilia]MBH1405340.1 hypothetical protein [Stenotrophomonas maltophilia]MBH1840731.1 hypothetical protein [Stenotrophomonas maltophilia]
MKLRKLKEGFEALRRQARPWIRSRRMEILVLVVCSFMVLLAPLYALGNPSVKKSWVTVYEAPRAGSTSVSSPPGQVEKSSSDEAFGRHLDTVTGLYSTVITVLTVMLAAVVSLAFFTVRAGSRAEMDKALRDVVESQDFKNFLQAKIQAGVATGIENELGNVQDLVDELRRMYEALDDVAVLSESENSDGDSKA